MSSLSPHEKLKRFRKPRTHLLYPTELDPGERGIGLSIAVLADLSDGRRASAPPLSGRAFVHGHREGFDALLAGTAGSRAEGARRGLGLLRDGIESWCPLSVLDLARAEAVADLAQGRRGRLAHLLCDEPFERRHHRGHALILADFAWGADEAEALRALALLAAEADAVVLTNASAGLADALRRGEAPAAWQALRQDPLGRHLVLCCPVVPAPPDGFSDAPCTMGAAWAVAARLQRLYGETGWVAGVTGDAPDALSPQLAAPDVAPTGPDADAAAEAGLLAVSLSADGRAFLRRAPTLHRPRRYGRPEADETAGIAAELPFVLVAGQVLRLLRAAADANDDYDDARLRALLAEVLRRHVQDPGLPIEERRVRTPLHEATLEFRPNPGGWQDMVCYLRPWLGPDAVMANAVRVVGRLPRRAD